MICATVALASQPPNHPARHEEPRSSHQSGLCFWGFADHSGMMSPGVHRHAGETDCADFCPCPNVPISLWTMAVGTAGGCWFTQCPGARAGSPGTGRDIGPSLPTSPVPSMDGHVHSWRENPGSPRLPSGSAWVHEVKHDGYRLIARRDEHRVRLYTRRGYDWSTGPASILG